MIHILALALLATPVVAAKPRAAPTAEQAPASSCDSGCLSGLAQRYVDALVSRKYSDLPWAQRVRYTENGVAMMIGDGIWGTVTAHTDKPLVVTDPSTATVGWFGTIEEHGQPAFYAMRLKADGNRIAEIETVIRRKEGRPPFGDPVSFTHDPAFAQSLPAAARMPRERMIALVQGYYNSLAANDGTVLTRFAPDCARVENGLIASSGDFGPAKFASGCEAQIKLGLFREIDAVRGLTFPVVDKARGLVVAIGDTDLSARTKDFVTTDGRPYTAEADYPRSYAFIAVFKLKDGAISRIEDTINEVPYLMPAWKERP